MIFRLLDAMMRRESVNSRADARFFGDYALIDVFPFVFWDYMRCGRAKMGFFRAVISLWLTFGKYYA